MELYKYSNDASQKKFYSLVIKNGKSFKLIKDLFLQKIYLFIIIIIIIIINKIY